MGLLRTALIFGAGYVIGRPEGRQQLKQLAGRPEVTQLRQQAVDTVSATVETGRQRLTKSAGSTDSAGTSDGSRGRRLPSFPRRGARSSASTATVSATDPLAADSASADAISTDVLSSDALFTDTASTGTTGTGTSSTGTSSTGTDKPSTPPTPRQR
jgi:hypothetical protein